MVAIRRMGNAERRQVQEFYARRGYAEAVSPDETVLVAESEGAVVAAMRITPDHGVMVLQGMQVAQAGHSLPAHELGAELLREAQAVIANHLCFCLTWPALVPYYAKVGFEAVLDGEAPGFLRARLREVRKVDPQVVVMRRWP